MERGASETVWPVVAATDLASEETEAMSSKTPAGKTATTGTRRIESGRLAKALDEPLTITAHAPAMYEVTNGDDVTYTVDVESGSCDCDDAFYRGDKFYCKHCIAACLHHLFAHGSDTRIVAQVARAVHDHGCPHGNACGGPCTPGQFPCNPCVESTRTGHWTVWTALVRDAGGEW